MKWLLLMAAMFLLSYCMAPAADRSAAWESEYLREHPLNGRIWHVAEQRFIDEEELLQLATADFLLLGEKHDNPDHHRLRHQLLMQLHERQGLALAAFEMLDSGQQEMLDALAGQRQDHANLEALKKKLNWDDGWDWDLYAPLIADLLQAGVPLRAANISRAEVSLAYRGELPEQRDVLNAAQHELLKEDIDTSHCGMLPPDQFDAMVRVQKARDARMAASLLEFRDPGIRVLIAGNYHIRKDLGVPQYLAAAQAASISIAFLEVAAGIDDPEAHLREAYSAGAFDFVWFTPASSQEDYCASLQ